MIIRKDGTFIMKLASIILGLLLLSDVTMASIQTSNLNKSSKKELTTCSKYIKELESVYHLDDSGEKYIDEKSVTQVLEKFNVNAGTTPYFRQYLLKVVDKLPEVTEADFVNLFYGEIGSCNSLHAEYNALRGLSGSIKTYNFSTEVEKKAEQLISNYLRNKSAYPGTFVEQMAYLSLLKKISKEGYFKLSEHSKETISQLFEDGVSIKNRLTQMANIDSWPDSMASFNKLNKYKKAKFLSAFSFELQKSEEIRKELIDLYSDMFIDY